ncbi:Zinc knuckle [Trichostrongylus colubriformis]|uniref:Zinc knuckle n=1 Tax=Trichostrongylus colubriformis TaxID=6319 RepID=A0AAN8ICW2_TRICO
MSGPITLRTQKALVTRYKNSLATAIVQGASVLANEESPKMLAIEATALRETAALVEKALENFTKTADGMEEITEEQDKQIQAYVEEVQAVVANAETLLIRIGAKRTGLQEATPMDEGRRPTVTKKTIVELPEIPIPTFDGKITDSENFWALFDASVHSQDLTGLQKFNYLLKALKGSAREAIKRYPITEANYAAAVELLHSKFGDKDKLIRSLQTRKETASARNSQLTEQRRLLDYLFALVTQLEQNGIVLNGSFVAQKILAKFQPDLQRRLLKQRVVQGNSEELWAVKQLLTDLDTLIKTEEQVSEMLPENEAFRGGTKGRPPPRRYETTSGQRSQMRQNLCIYCSDTEHNSLRCPKVDSARNRREFLKEHKLCINCGKPNHISRECLRSGCTLCDGDKHHFSLCPKRLPTALSSAGPTKSAYTKSSRTTQQPKRADAKQPTSSAKTGAHCINSENK